MKFLLVSLLFLASTIASAAFDSVPPPTGWVANPSGSGALYGGTGSPGAKPVFTGNANWYKYMSEVKTAGGAVRIPWYMRLSSSSGAYFAARAFTPAGLGLIALPIVVEMLAQSGISLLYDENGLPRWGKPMPSTGGNPYHYATFSATTPVGVCQAAVGYAGLGAYVSYSTSGAYNDIVGYCTYVGGSQAAVAKCPTGQIWNGQQCIVPNPVLRPLTEEEFKELVTPLPMPIDLPEKLPFGLPVDDPIFNPYPAPNGVPQPVVNPDGLPRPLPAPRPNPDPFPYVEPGTKISPAPSPDDKFRVEKKPVETPKPDLTPTPKPTGEPAPAPDPNQPGTTEPEKDPGLCAMFPDILACEKLGDAPESPELPDQRIDVAITPISFGSAGSCPADRMVNITLINRSIPITYSYVCQLATGTKPVILALAWLSAALIVLGMGRKS